MATRWKILVNDGRRALVEVSEYGDVRRRPHLSEEEVDQVVLELVQFATKKHLFYCQLYTEGAVCTCVNNE